MKGKHWNTQLNWRKLSNNEKMPRPLCRVGRPQYIREYLSHNKKGKHRNTQPSWVWGVRQYKMPHPSHGVGHPESDQTSAVCQRNIQVVTTACNTFGINRTKFPVLLIMEPTAPFLNNCLKCLHWNHLSKRNQLMWHIMFLLWPQMPTFHHCLIPLKLNHLT